MYQATSPCQFPLRAILGSLPSNILGICLSTVGLSRHKLLFLLLPPTLSCLRSSCPQMLNPMPAVVRRSLRGISP